MTTSASGASRPPIPGILQDDGQRVVQAGAEYVPVRGADDHVHWAYAPKLRVDRVQLWCQDRSEFGMSGRTDAAQSVTLRLGSAPPCKDCTGLAPLPTREGPRGQA